MYMDVWYVGDVIREENRDLQLILTLLEDTMSLYARERLVFLDNPDRICRALNTDINCWARSLNPFYLPLKPGCWMRPLDITGNEFVSVTIQCLMRVIALRNFFLLPENYQHCKSPLIHRFGELTQRYWSAWNSRKELRPYAFLDAVKRASNNRYQIGVESDPVQFMAWLLNSLHAGLRTPNNDDSIIHRCFQGELEVMKEIPSQGSIGDGQNKTTTNDEADLAAITVETCRMPFQMLGLDLPTPPFFEDNRTQVPLSDLLKKFDGEFVTEVVWPQRQKMRYRIIRLPQYLILHMNRFTKNNFFAEKNRNLIEFPVKELDMEDYVPLPIAEQVFSIYDFVAHVIHHGQPGDSGHDETRGDGLYNLYVHHKSSSSWEEKLGQEDKRRKETHMRLNFVNDRVVALSESSIQIYEQQY